MLDVRTIVARISLKQIWDIMLNVLTYNMGVCGV